MNPKSARSDMNTFDSRRGLPKGIWEHCHETPVSTRDREFIEYLEGYCLLQTEVAVAEFLNKLK